jgi:rhamnulokinase
MPRHVVRGIRPPRTGIPCTAGHTYEGGGPVTALTVAAVDLGPESATVAAARFDGTRLSLDVHHRLLRWDTGEIWRHMGEGLCSLAADTAIASVGVDSAEIGYGLYGAADTLLEEPVAQGDTHRASVFERTVRQFGAHNIHAATGQRVAADNALFNLAAEKELRPGLLRRAERLRMFPDIFHHLLSGSVVTERTAASATGMYNVAADTWATPLLEKMGLPCRILPGVADAGTDVGPVVGFPDAAGLRFTRVVLPPAHDAASAVFAIPYAAADTLFITSGPRSLAGVVLQTPVAITEFGGAELAAAPGPCLGSAVRLQRHVMGLWMLGECRRQLAREGRGMAEAALMALAADAVPQHSWVDPDAIEFSVPGDMPARIRESCRRNHMPVPETVGQVARVVIASLALGYRLAAEDIERATGIPITSIAVVGAGGENAALQQATANAAGRPVVCWASDAAALGNAAGQLCGLGEISSLREVGDVVRASTRTRTFVPRAGGAWDEAAGTLRASRHDDGIRHGSGARGGSIALPWAVGE